VGSIEVGTACEGLAPQFEPDLFTVSPSDVTLTRRPRSKLLVARCG
jgi:hypothetical protein